IGTRHNIQRKCRRYAALARKNVFDHCGDVVIIEPGSNRLHAFDYALHGDFIRPTKEANSFRLLNLLHSPQNRIKTYYSFAWEDFRQLARKLSLLRYRFAESRRKNTCKRTSLAIKCSFLKKWLVERVES